MTRPTTTPTHLQQIDDDNFFRSNCTHTQEMSVPLKDNMCTAELQFVASKECIDMLITMSMTKI